MLQDTDRKTARVLFFIAPAQAFGFLDFAYIMKYNIFVRQITSVTLEVIAYGSRNNKGDVQKSL